MKIEQQIEWNRRLWCSNAWGSQGDRDSGLYRYICYFYGISFYTYSQGNSFLQVCQLALQELKKKKKKKEMNGNMLLAMCLWMKVKTLMILLLNYVCL